uniref:Spt4/RpoE2 zinc finger domain-containing protein n=1 Tax=Anopheles maculatus TaxID=74869 RepID=A0A182SPW7_9DIPT
MLGVFIDKGGLSTVAHLRSRLTIRSSFDQFETDGCDNCEDFLRMKNNREQVYDCTSNNFDG